MALYDLTEGIAKRNNDRQGGLKKVYLMEYVEYSRSQIVLNDQRITSMPTATIYEYDVWTASFDETQSREAGGEVYDQSLTFDIQGTQVSQELWKLARKNHHCIVMDRQGNGRFLGIWNGLEGIVNDKSGAGVSDMNGYSITLSGKEDNQAYFISNLEAKFTIVKGTPDVCIG